MTRRTLALSWDSGGRFCCLGWDQSRDPVVFGYKEGQTKATKSPEFTRGIGLPKHRPN